MGAIEYIQSFSRSGSPVRNLDRISSLMRAMGDPQDRLRFIHIAGTNGKGSMAQMFSEVLVRAGYKTGLFTSPYIIEFHDRIRFNNENISKAELEEVVTVLRSVVDVHPMKNSFSQFEITQAAAFLWFLKKGCDVVVLEAGLGGLLDSTNIVTPLVSVIGSIGLDHTAVLGKTLPKIAYQKAGIIKSGIPCVLSPGAESGVLKVFEEQAEQKGSELVVPYLEKISAQECSLSGSRFVYKGEEYRLSMPGEHQIRNAMSVIEALRLIRNQLPVSKETIKEGLAAASVYGRVETACKKPFIILDGGHNPDAVKALAETLSLAEGKIRAVIGMHDDKDAEAAVKLLSGQVKRFYPVSGFSDKDMPAEELAWHIGRAGGDVSLSSNDNIEELIARLVREFPEDILLVCGSLYLVSWFKEHINPDNLPV